MAALEGGGERRRFRRHTHSVEQGHAAGRGRRRPQRLELILGRLRQQPGDDRYLRPRSRPQPVTEHGEQHVFAQQSLRDAGEAKEQLATPVFGPVQAHIGRAAGDGTTNVDEVAIAIGARAQDGVGEDDGVALGPSDLRAQRRAVQRLIGGAGECRPAAHRLIRLHHARRPAADLLRAAKDLRVQQVHRADVKRRRHDHLRPPGGQPLGELQPGVAMVEAAIDVG